MEVRVVFQSAPLTEARGDADPDMHAKFGVFVVSIRSPHRSEGRSVVRVVLLSPDCVSIRSPHRSEGRFFSAYFGTGGVYVSIRSPHRSEGRFPVTG